MKEPERKPPEHPHPIRAVAIVTSLVVLGVVAAYLLSEWADPVYGAQRRHYQQAVAAGPAVQAVSLGNSHGRAVSFEAMGLRGADLRSSGGDFYEALHYLRSIRPHLPELEYVFLTLSPFANDNNTDPARREVRKEAYVATGNYTPVADDRDVVHLALLAPVVRADNWAGVPSQLLKKLRPRRGGRRGAAREGARPDREGEGGHPPAERAELIRRSAVRKAAAHRTWQEQSLAANPALCEESREVLREIARLAAPAQLVLYTAPFPPTYLRHYEAAGGCHLDRFAAGLAAASPTVTYFDDRGMAPFTDDSGLFRDGDHVNSEGARLYSEALAERLGLR